MKNTGSVLFDVPGPRARRRIMAVSVVSVAVFAAAITVAVLRLNDRGQFAERRWDWAADPAYLRFLGYGLLNTVKVALVAGAIALVVGAVLAAGRIAPARSTRIAAGTWIEFWRAIPLLLLIYFVSLGFPVWGLSWPAFWFLVFGLAIYNSAVFAETFRTGIVSLHSGQREAAAALGLTFWQSLRLVEYPQAIRRMLPTLVSQYVTLLKDSSLGFVIPYMELLRRSQVIGQSEAAVLQSYVVAAVIFVAVNASLSYLARWLERRSARTVRAAVPLREKPQLAAV